MDIIFINPPKSQNPDDHVLNMAMLWLASLLRAKGIDTKVFTILGNRIEEDVEAAIKATHPTWVAISCKWWNTLYSALKIAKVIRRRFPYIKILMGGHTATVFSRELLGTKLVDVVLLGDVERSLVELVSNNRVVGGVSAIGLQFDTTRVFEDRDFLQKQFCLDPPDLLVDKPNLVPAYVWTGRGCTHRCFYCAENRQTAKEIFDQRVPFVREAEQVVHDILRFGNRSHLILDYEYPSFDSTDEYVASIVRKLEGTAFRCYFFSWGLPSKRLIDIFSDTFDYSVFCIDVQVFSEPLRKKLSEMRLTKPFYTNHSLFEIVEHAESKGNIIIDGTGIAGLPLESDKDREEGLRFIDLLHSTYRCVRDVRPSPLHVIPGTLPTKSDTFYDLHVVRRTFDDFYAFTEETFHKSLTYYSQYREHHPYGIHRQDKPKEIIDYMKDVDRLTRAHRRRKTRVTRKVNNGTLYIDIEDFYTPLTTLLDMLSADNGTQGCQRPKLHLSLGTYTYFHHSWFDYTSESGENCASVVYQERLQESPKTLVSALSKFEQVRLQNQKDSSWGFLKEIVREALR